MRRMCQGRSCAQWHGLALSGVLCQGKRQKEVQDWPSFGFGSSEVPKKLALALPWALCPGRGLKERQDWLFLGFCAQERPTTERKESMGHSNKNEQYKVAAGNIAAAIICSSPDSKLS